LTLGGVSTTLSTSSIDSKFASLIPPGERLALFGGPRVLLETPRETWRKIDDNVKRAVHHLMDEGICTIPGGTGVVQEFESAFAELTGSKHALAMNSGTSALHSAYVAIGVGPGDEVIVPTYTWHATITPVLHCAATPVFCDIDPRTLTICPTDIERKITPQTKAISVVHVWGNVCDMSRILDIAKRHNLAVIEDCSHAHGASWHGQPVGSMGSIGCFSCQGPKAVSGGELGVAVTNDADLYDRMILLGHFGRAKISANESIKEVGDMSLGAKYRAHAWAVAMAKEDLKRLSELNARRTLNYRILNEGLSGCFGIERIETLPGAQRGGFLEFKFKLTDEALDITTRDRIVEAIQAEGVPMVADRYSSFNYTYGLLHTAPLFTTFDLRSIGGCFYDPKTNKSSHPISLPHSESVAGRLIGMDAFIGLQEATMHKMVVGMRKVMSNLDALAL